MHSIKLIIFNCVIFYFAIRVAGILPSDWETLNAGNSKALQPHFHPIWAILKYMSKPLNVIDLASILPLYISLFSNQGESSSYVRVLRLFRLARVLRLLKLLGNLQNADVAAEIIFETIRNASTLLSVFLFFLLITILLFGCIVYLVEGGEFTVNRNFPNGAYLQYGSDTEESRFSHIGSGIYWAVGTITGTGIRYIYFFKYGINFQNLIAHIFKTTIMS